MTQTYTIVPVSFKTGKELKRPKTGQMVQVAVKGPRGGLKILRKDPQEYYKTDFIKLAQMVEKQNKPVFEIYEQKLRRIKREPETGKKLYKTDKNGNYKLTDKGKKIPIYETKLTIAQKGRLQKPALVKDGKITRSLDLAYRKTAANYQDLKKLREIKLLTPNVTMAEQKLQGNTINEALSNLHADIDLKRMKKEGFVLYYNCFAVIDTPDDQRIKIPVSGVYRDFKFDGTSRLKVGDAMETFGRSRVQIIANLQQMMAKSLRYSFKHAGYTFSSLRALSKIEAIANRMPDKDRAEQIKHALYFGNKQKFFESPETRLKQITKEHEVTLYVKLEFRYKD